MGVQLAIVALGEPGGLAHQTFVDRKRRTGRERDADLRPGLGIVEQLQDALAVGEDRVLVLHHRIRRQAAVLLAAVHRAARHRHAQPERARLLDLDVDGVFQALGKEIVMVRGRRAARQHQFGQGETRGEAELTRLQPRPDRIERHQPGKQIPVDRGRVGAGQGLKKVVMRVDEARQHDMARGVENRVNGRRRLAPPGDRLRDAPVLDDEAALGAFSEYGERVLDPGAHSLVNPLAARARDEFAAKELLCHERSDKQWRRPPREPIARRRYNP
jgi:hypothetical protein